MASFFLQHQQNISLLMGPCDLLEQLGELSMQTKREPKYHTSSSPSYLGGTCTSKIFLFKLGLHQENNIRLELLEVLESARLSCTIRVTPFQCIPVHSRSVSVILSCSRYFPSPYYYVPYLSLLLFQISISGSGRGELDRIIFYPFIVYVSVHLRAIPLTPFLLSNFIFLRQVVPIVLLRI